MRTVTEFPGVVVRQVLKTRADLVSQGTAEDQLEAALGQALKIEGDRLTHLSKAVTMVGDRGDAVSRVRVFQGEDESKMPKGVVKEGEFYYLVEFIASAQPKKEAREEKGGKGGKGGRRGGRDDKRGGKGGRDRRDGGKKEGQTSAAPKAASGGLPKPLTTPKQ